MILIDCAAIYLYNIKLVAFYYALNYERYE